MTLTSKREVARILRAEAENIRRHGFTDPFTHNFNCLQAQVLRKEACEGCLLYEYVPQNYRSEAFPCQHIDETGCMQIAADPALWERVAVRMLRMADELEARAESEESSC